MPVLYPRRIIILPGRASICDAEFTTYRYGEAMYTGRIYNVSRVHGDGRNGLVACGTEKAAGARVGPALRRERFGLAPQVEPEIESTPR